MFCLAWGASVCDRAPNVGHISWWPPLQCMGHVPRHVGAGHQREQRQHVEEAVGRGAFRAGVPLAWPARALSRQLGLVREARCSNWLSWLVSA